MGFIIQRKLGFFPPQNCIKIVSFQNVYCFCKSLNMNQKTRLNRWTIILNLLYKKNHKNIPQSIYSLILLTMSWPHFDGVWHCRHAPVHAHFSWLSAPFPQTQFSLCLSPFHLHLTESLEIYRSALFLWADGETTISERLTHPLFVFSLNLIGKNIYFLQDGFQAWTNIWLSEGM